MLRLATAEDYPLVYKFAHNFLSETPYKEWFSEEVLSDYITEFLGQSNNTHVCLLHGDKGMLAGYKTPFTFGEVYLATEVGWWVEPEYRKTGIGKELKDAFEFWANKVGCSMAVMVSLDEQVGKFYEKDGYQLCENLYMKGLV